MTLRLTLGFLLVAAIGSQPALAAGVQRTSVLGIRAVLARIVESEKSASPEHLVQQRIRQLAPLCSFLLDGLAILPALPTALSHPADCSAAPGVPSLKRMPSRPASQPYAPRAP